jgi:cation transport ATPase
MSRTATQQSQTGSCTFTLKVDGLDNQSQARIQSEMQKIGKVESVQVNQKSGLVYITFKNNSKISNNQVMQAIKQAGYKPKEVIKGPLDLSQLEQNMPKKNK